ncbi:mandelate racemase [Pantoea sp. ICBG 828]|uniref:mandelate racemase/muconate lactonizing enzyme family protein n=1 Tax=unclassified Pantoea TaxID=2630326 RepID=UPI000CE56C32|nr:mandelate racemase/muconate lactonizing enzyme family protein [Pantoea sp. ICBG 828]NIG33824.1 mandelate racemase [Pantoea sp. Ap-959]PPC69241.1 mandelate racemase [Pantoea sp. ICBG 828]
MKATLWRGQLRYDAVMLHTASSGAISALDTLWLRLDDGTRCGTGEVRLNIQYLHGCSADRVLENITRALAAWNWALAPQAMLERVHADGAGLLAPARMLFDMALHDLLAQQAGVSLAHWLGAAAASPGYPTNQTLFWGSEAQMLTQAEQYVARGFTQLKLRTGVADVATDLARLRALRARFSEAITLAIDVNGQWSLAQAHAAFPALQALNLSYVEQPLAPANDAALAQLSGYGVPIMLDESLNSPAAIDQLIAANGALWGHLKLVKLGGIAPTLAAARRLQAASIPFMIGQMNEGHAATAAALQVCRAMQPRFAELYGADGLINDAVSGLHYQQGTVFINDLPGLGVHFDAARATFLQESGYATAE